jgi:hypothetical protein
MVLGVLHRIAVLAWSNDPPLVQIAAMSLVIYNISVMTQDVMLAGCAQSCVVACQSDDETFEVSSASIGPP